MKLKGNVVWIIIALAALYYFFIYKPSDVYGITTPGGGIKVVLDQGPIAKNIGTTSTVKTTTKKKGFFAKIGAGLKKALPVLKKVGGMISPRLGQLLQ